MSDEAIHLKSELVKTRNVIAKKFRQAQIDRVERERAIGETFAPVLKKITKMVDPNPGSETENTDNNNSLFDDEIAEMSKKQPKKKRSYKKKKVQRASNKYTKARDRKRKIVGSGEFRVKSFIPYNSNIVYEYYDDPNELCNRLRLLMSSQTAGNSNHNQEIHSILEELRERNIIL